MAQVSVILSTYNSPEWLAKVLWGYSAQSFTDFEVVIADDGSTDHTATLVEQLRRETGLKLQHVWQEHKGFRKCRILNEAILAARGEYLVFSDGDCIPRRDFVAQHVRFAKPGRFLSGGIVRLPMSISQWIAKEDVLAGEIFQAKTLMALGMPFSRKMRFLLPESGLTWLLERASFTRATFNGSNSSAWKADVVRTNGFDERMHYGGLDRELGERLVNAGIRSFSVRLRATCLHLDHERSYAIPELIQANRQLRSETRRLRVTSTPLGLSQHDSLPQTSAADNGAEAVILSFPKPQSKTPSNPSATRRAA